VAGPDLTCSDGTTAPTVVGCMPVGVLVPGNHVVPHYDHGKDEGYQRAPQMPRIRKLVHSLLNGRADLPTAVLLNLRHDACDEICSNGTFDLKGLRAEHPGRLPFYVVDGQHRIAALEIIAKEKEEWRSHPLPFVCILGASREEEMRQFYTVNSTAKSVRTDLAYTLLRRLRDDDERVVDELDESGKSWIVTGQRLAEHISRDENSKAWCGRIRFPGEPKGETLAPSASFVKSLQPLLKSRRFSLRRSMEEKCEILNAYWEGLRIILPNAFADPEGHLLQKGLGVWVMHEILADAIEIAADEGKPLDDPRTYDVLLGDALRGLEEVTQGGEGDVAVGSDFWLVGGEGAAGGFSSGAGKRVLVNKIRRAAGWEA